MMHRNAIVRELEHICDATWVYRCNLGVAEKILDAFSCTLEELQRATSSESMWELQGEIHEHLIGLAAACMDYLIFSGLSFVTAWEHIADELARVARISPEETRFELAARHWWVALKCLHQNAVRQRDYEAAPAGGEPPVAGSVLVSMVTLGAAAVAALEELEVSILA